MPAAKKVANKRIVNKTNVERLVLVKYGEIFLKSEPVRHQYEKRLKENIRAGLRAVKIDIENFEIRRTRGRLFVRVSGRAGRTSRDFESACHVLEKTFGIVSFSPCWHLNTSSAREIQKFVKKNYAGWVERGQTFAARVKRNGVQKTDTAKKSYTSMQLAKLVGDVVNRKVNLSQPDVKIFVEVRNDESYIYTSKEVLKGPGGLPVGTSGKVVVLLSGGIDSAVAAWLMMKRGCRVVALYADNGPYVSDAKKALKRVKDMLGVLQSWSAGWRIPLFVFDHGENLKRFLEADERDVPKKFVCLLCKRMMYRVANEFAKQKEIEAKAIVTGESLGEVASQTLDNLAVLDEASERGLPVFRPLIGNDKEENITLAKRIGTYDVSISLGDGGKCKAVPAAPRTKGRLNELTEIESKLPMKKLLRESVKSIKQI